MRFLYLDWPHLCHRLEMARAPVRRPDGTVAAAQISELVVIGGQPWEPGTVPQLRTVACGD